MAPLTGTQEDDTKGFLGELRNGRKLQAHCAAKLFPYLIAQGTPVSELTTDQTDESSVADNVEEWKALGEDAGLTPPQCLALANWIKYPRGGSSAAGGARKATPVGAVLDALSCHGINVTPGLEKEIGDRLKLQDKGARLAQHTSLTVIWLIYTAEWPGEDALDFLAQKGLVEGEVCEHVVDLRLCKPYFSRHKHATTVPTLERVLSSKHDPTGAMWIKFKGDIATLLSDGGFQHAVARWNKITAYAASRNIGSANYVGEREFIHYYFFVEHLGKGMPVEMCVASALAQTDGLQARETRSREAQQATVPATAPETPALAFAGMLPPALPLMQMGGVAPPAPMLPPYPFGAPPVLPPTMFQPNNELHTQQMMQQLIMSLPGLAPQQPPALAIEEVTALPCGVCGKSSHATTSCSFYAVAKKAAKEADRAQADKRKAAAAAKAAAVALVDGGQ